VRRLARGLIFQRKEGWVTGNDGKSLRLVRKFLVRRGGEDGSRVGSVESGKLIGQGLIDGLLEEC